MAIPLNDNIYIKAGKPAEPKYLNGVANYGSTAEANATIQISERYLGLTHKIGPDEYWYKDGLANINLVLKLSGNSSGTGSITIENGLYSFGASARLGGVLIEDTYIWSNRNGDSPKQKQGLSIGDEYIGGTTVNGQLKFVTINAYDRIFLGQVPDALGRACIEIENQSITLRSKDHDSSDVNGTRGSDLVMNNVYANYWWTGTTSQNRYAKLSLDQETWSYLKMYNYNGGLIKDSSIVVDSNNTISNTTSFNNGTNTNISLLYIGLDFLNFNQKSTVNSGGSINYDSGIFGDFSYKELYAKTSNNTQVGKVNITPYGFEISTMNSGAGSSIISNGLGVANKTVGTSNSFTSEYTLSGVTLLEEIGFITPFYSRVINPGGYSINYRTAGATTLFTEYVNPGTFGITKTDSDAASMFQLFTDKLSGLSIHQENADLLNSGTLSINPIGISYGEGFTGNVILIGENGSYQDGIYIDSVTDVVNQKIIVSKSINTTVDIASSDIKIVNTVQIADSNKVLVLDDDNIIRYKTGITSGPSSGRPITNNYNGQQYFDEDLGIPVWYFNTNWVNAAGAILYLP